MASFEDVGERALIQKMMSVIRPCGSEGPGDDAAVLNNVGDAVICSDLVTFERHKPKEMSFEHFGWTAAAVNFSDLASMGAKPRGLLVSLGIPGNTDEQEIFDMMSGADQCAEFCETFIVGGDTKPGSGFIAGTAIGSMDGRTPMTRKGAQPGDIVAVTGCLGGPAAGFYALENGVSNDDLLFPLFVPVPRVEEGILLSETGVITSCMDISDGLAVTARTICEQSIVGMELEWEFLPIHENVDQISTAFNIPKEDLVLYWGGEYELLFTFNKKDIQKLYDRGIAFSIIGIVTNEKSVYISEGDERKEMKDGRY